MESNVTEQWRPGEVDITKITKGFTYLVAAGISSPPSPPNNTPSIRFKPPLSKVAKKRLAAEVRRKLVRLTKEKQRQRDRKALKSFLLDSGATSHYVRPSDKLEHVGPSDKEVTVATGHKVKASAQAKLPFQIHESARIAEVVPGLQHNSLVSVGKLADHGYKTTFLPYNDGVVVSEGDNENETTVLQGWRETDGSRL